MLSPTEQEKYSRQTIMTEIGAKGQQKLKDASVVVVGVGALGSNTAEMLARTGVGKIILIDSDTVETCNLQRQTLFVEEDIGRSKVRVAKERLEKINSLITIETHETLIAERTTNLLKADLVLDCTDNFETRFIINKHCRTTPWIYAACVKTAGYVMPILPNGPCLQCFLQDADLDSACTIGILNTVPPIISAIQTTLAIQLLIGENVEPILQFVNPWNGTFRKLKVKKNDLCKVC
jgi:molybdopterin-synthase adenylyltransferase